MAIANLSRIVFLVVAASGRSADADVQSATGVRDMPIEDLEVEIKKVTSKGKGGATDILQMAKHPLGTVLPGLVVSVAEALLKPNKKKWAGIRG